MAYELHFLVALGQTIAIETLGLLLLFRFVWKKQESRPTAWQIITAGFLTTGLTLPYLWFVLPAFWSGTLYVWGGEILVTLVEFIILKRILTISYWQAFLASFLVNLLSVLMGRFLL